MPVLQRITGDKGTVTYDTNWKPQHWAKSTHMQVCGQYGWQCGYLPRAVACTHTQEEAHPISIRRWSTLTSKAPVSQNLNLGVNPCSTPTLPEVHSMGNLFSYVRLLSLFLSPSQLPPTAQPFPREAWATTAALRGVCSWHLCPPAMCLQHPTCTMDTKAPGAQ